MAESELFKLATGNLIKDSFLQKHRNPTFLRRNLEKAIEVHENMRLGLDSLEDEHGSRIKWAPPSLETITRVRRKQMTNFEIVAIHSLDPGATRGQRGGARPTKKGQLFKVPVSIHGTLSGHSGLGMSEFNPCKRFDCPDATIEGTSTARGTTVDVHRSAFTMHPDDLKMPDTHDISLSINFHAPEDVEEVLSALHVRVKTPSTCRWVAHIEDVIHFPQHQLFPLFSLDSRSRRTELGIGVEIRLNHDSYPGGSALATFNKLQQNSSSPRSQHALVDHSADPSTRNIVFSFLCDSQKRKLKYSMIRCPYCVRQPPSTVLQSIEKLHFHLKNNHEAFDHELREVKQVHGSDYWLFEVDVARLSRQLTSNRHPDPREVTIIAPRRPFNIQEYLNGDESWLQEAHGSKVTSRPISRERRLFSGKVRPIPKIERPKIKVPKVKDGVTLFRSFTKRVVEEGEELTESDDDIDMEWLNHKAEQLLIQDVSIPAAAKKLRIRYDRHVREERLSGDAHIGDSLIRFVHENRTWLQSEKLVGEFEKKLRELLEDKAINQQMFDACVRSVRKRPKQRPTPKSQLPNLEGIPVHPTPPLTPERHMASRSPSVALTMRETTPDPPITLRRARHTNITQHDAVDMSTGKIGRPEQPQSHKQTAIPPHDRCLCGEITLVHSSKPTIHCQSIACIRRVYHIDCVVKHWNPIQRPKLRDNGWFCKTCEDDEDIDSGGSSIYVRR